MESQRTNKPIKIMVGYDGSANARAAVQMICDLPVSPGSRILLLTVFTPRQTSDHEKLRLAMVEASQWLKDKGFLVESELILGHPAEKLIEVAEQERPDLIAVGARGLRATFGILLGGISQQVVEYANWPVLVVREPYQGLKRLLVVTDGSPFSQCALDYLSAFPLPQELDIRVLHVLPPLVQPEMIAYTWPVAPGAMPPPDLPTLETWQREEEEQGLALLQQAQQSLSGSGLESGTLLRRGDAATEILEYCKQFEPSLIVAGSRGLSEVRSWLLGSVSRKLIHYANTSILIVKRCVPNMA